MTNGCNGGVYRICYNRPICKALGKGLYSLQVAYDVCSLYNDIRFTDRGNDLCIYISFCKNRTICKALGQSLFSVVCVNQSIDLGLQVAYDVCLLVYRYPLPREG